MRASDMSRYLKSADVKTKQKIATIAYLVEAEEVGQDKRKKPVLYFEDGAKPMVMNLVNFETIEAAFGDSNDWPGHKIIESFAPRQRSEASGLTASASSRSSPSLSQR